MIPEFPHCRELEIWLEGGSKAESSSYYSLVLYCYQGHLEAGDKGQDRGPHRCHNMWSLLLASAHSNLSYALTQHFEGLNVIIHAKYRAQSHSLINYSQPFSSFLYNVFTSL